MPKKASHHEDFHPEFFLSNHEEFWLGVADVSPLRLNELGYWWASDHPTWGLYTPHLLCPPTVVDDLVTKRLCYGIARPDLPAEVELYIEAIKHQMEAEPGRGECDLSEIDIVWPTAAGHLLASLIDWPALRDVLARETFSLYRQVG